MNLGEKFKKIASLLPAADLKAYCKETGLRGYSKFNKAGLVNFIETSKSEEELEEFLETKGKEKLESTLKDAEKLLNGAPVSGETIESLDFDGKSIKANFKGMNWDTAFSGTVDGLGMPNFEFSCDCRVSDSGALCVHYWAVVLYMIAEGDMKHEALGGFQDIAENRFKRIIKNVKEKGTKILAAAGAEDFSDLSLEEILKLKTMGTRFKKAKVELGLEAPKSTKKKPNPEKEKKVNVEFPIKETGDPASIFASFYKNDDGGWRKSSLTVMIDEKTKVLAHENCMDFQIRMLRDKKLCKHLIEMFLSLEDEPLSRRILEHLQGYKFQTIIPESSHAGTGLDAEILGAEPEIQLDDQEGLKDQLVEYLIKNEDLEKNTSLAHLSKEFGKNVKKILDILKNEGIISEYKPGYFRPK